MFLGSLPDESVSEALLHFEQIVADDPVDFDCADIDIKENVRTVSYMYEPVLQLLQSITHL